MNFITQIMNFFTSLLQGQGQEPHIKQDLRKIEVSLKQSTPILYKNKQAQPNMAEAFRLLYVHTKPLAELFADTVASEDSKIKEHYIDLLIETGFTALGKEAIQKLSYESRKQDYYTSETNKKALELNKKDLELVLRELTNENLKLIENTLITLDLFCDICNFSYISIIKIFEPSFDPASTEQHHFEAIDIDLLEQQLLDYYFLIGNLSISAAMARATTTLAQQKFNNSLSETQIEAILGHIKKVSSLTTKVLSPEIIKSFLRLIKNDPSFEPKVTTPQKGILQDYTSRLRKQFENDTQRIETEMQDQTIEKETENLFENTQIIPLTGYTHENSKVFIQNNAGAFLLVTPLQIIKTFFSVYLDTRVQVLLNDLIVEGFFNNSQYKTNFSSIVYSCFEAPIRIKEFEDSFSKGGKNDISIMLGYLKDSHSDSSFMVTLTKMIDNINLEAKNLIQTEVSTILQLDKRIAELITDSKKSTPEHISNLKVLFSSPRNRDNTEYLETSFPRWNIFLDIMKNYAIIGEVRDE